MSKTTCGFLTRPDAEIYYEVTGDGPAVVFAHGLGGNHMSWWQQIPYFAQRFKCVTFAHRGFSPSRIAIGGPDPGLYAEDLSALIDRLELKDVRLVAQSMGGWTCLDYSLRYPDRVKALVMAATPGVVDLKTLNPEAREKIQSWRAEYSGREQDLVNRGIHPAAGERMASEQPALHFLYREIDRMSGSLDKVALRVKLMAACSVPVSRLAALPMPIMFITGEEDIVIPPPAVEALASAVPGAKFAAVPEAGHSVYFERATRFNEIVGGFLS